MQRNVYLENIKQIFQVKLLRLEQALLIGTHLAIAEPWTSSVEAHECFRWPNWQTNLVVIVHDLSLLLCHFTNTTTYHLGYHRASSPYTKELHGAARSFSQLW